MLEGAEYWMYSDVNEPSKSPIMVLRPWKKRKKVKIKISSMFLIFFPFFFPLFFSNFGNQNPPPRINCAAR